MPMAERRVFLTISGKVQGVFFRETTKTVARELGLNGWVRNTDEGTVEALAQGASEAIDKLIEFVHRGPPRASVTHVSVEDRPVGAELTTFVVER